MYGLDEIAQIINPHEPNISVSTWNDIARRLSIIARRDEDWSWRYIQGINQGTIQPSRKCLDAIAILASSLDSTIPLELLAMKPVTVLAYEGTIPENTVIDFMSRQCADPFCTVNFIPAVYNQRYCPIHKKRRNK